MVVIGTEMVLVVDDLTAVFSYAARAAELADSASSTGQTVY